MLYKVLHDQIDSLRRTMDRQGEMLGLLMNALVDREGGETVGPNGVRRRENGRHGENQDPFALGSDGEDGG
jgi:hypothetical protein